MSYWKILVKKDINDTGTLVQNWVGGGGLVKQGWLLEAALSAGAHLTLLGHLYKHLVMQAWSNMRSEGASKDGSLSYWKNFKISEKMKSFTSPPPNTDPSCGKVFLHG